MAGVCPARRRASHQPLDRKSTRLNSSHTEIYTLSLHDALPIFAINTTAPTVAVISASTKAENGRCMPSTPKSQPPTTRSEEHTSELQPHRDLHSFPTRRSSDLCDQHHGTHRRRDQRVDQGGEWQVYAQHAEEPATNH